MPVLGSTGAVDRRGVRIPYGALDTWKAARALHATDRPEVVFLGDSTFWGECVTDAYYSPVAKVRELSDAAGYTNGGLGILGINDTAVQIGASVVPVTASASLGNGRPLYNLMMASGINLTTGASITYQHVFGTGGGSWRLHTGRTGDSGAFTYSQDGGSTTTHTIGTSGGFGVLTIPVATSGTHTLTLAYSSGTSNDVTVEPLNATGIVYHRHAIQGAQAGDFVQNGNDDAANANRWIQAALGVTQGGTAVESVEGTHPASRKVRLAFWTVGINDLNGKAGAAQPRSAEFYEQATNIFCEVARAAGADPVICIPHWKANQGGTQYGRAGALMARTLAGVAAAQSAVLIDNNEFLGGPYGRWNSSYFTSNGVHLRRAGYEAIGSGLFNTVVNAQ